MAVIELLFAAVLIGAVPLGVGLIELGDEVLDERLGTVKPFVLPGAASLAIATVLAPSPIAAALAAPWQLLTAALALLALAGFVRDADRWRPSRRLATEISIGFLAFGAANASSFASGLRPLGFSPTIVLLTAVHFHAAGFVLMTAGILAFCRQPSVSSAIGVAAVTVGSVITAAGFVGVPGAAVLGAIVVAVGGLLVGLATVRVAGALRGRPARWLTVAAGCALFVSMPLAIAWGVGTELGATPFDLDLMIRTHGTINALAVSVPAMVGWALDARGSQR